MDQRLEKLQYVFNPRSLAFVGATDKLGKWGFIIFNNLIHGGWEGKLYPVNPSRAELLGYKVYPRVNDIPEAIDLAVINVPAAAVPAALDDCIAKAVKAVVVITAGFKEMGGDAARVEAELVRKARAAGMVMVGPNGQGVCCPASKLFAWMPHFFYPPPGPVAVISQSGNVQGLMINALLELGIGVSKGVSSGNEADLRSEDYFAYLAADPDTKVILSYMEGLTDGQRFLAAARETSPRKPIVLLKGGRSDGGVSAAKSHTGALAVSDEMFEAACRQAGIVRAATIYESAAIAAAFIDRPLPRGRRVGIVTGGGGLGVIAADLCAKAGLQVPALSAPLLEKIAARLPDWFVPGNPIDLVAGMTFDAVPFILETLAASREVDAILLLFIGPRSHAENLNMLNEQSRAMQKTWKSMQGMYAMFQGMIAKMMLRTGVPIYLVSNFTDGLDDNAAGKFKPGCPAIYRDLETPCAAIKAMADYHDFLQLQARAT
jgi:acyl-CoA synthetase (NDP forming)